MRAAREQEVGSLSETIWKLELGGGVFNSLEISPLMFCIMREYGEIIPQGLVSNKTILLLSCLQIMKFSAPLKHCLTAAKNPHYSIILQSVGFY